MLFVSLAKIVVNYFCVASLLSSLDIEQDFTLLRGAE